MKRSDSKEIQSNKLQAWGCIVLWYDSYRMQLGLLQVVVVGKLVHKWERDSYIQKEKQYTKQYHNTEYSK